MKLLGKEISIGDIVLVCEPDYEAIEAEIIIIRDKVFLVDGAGTFYADTGLAEYTSDLNVIWAEKVFEDGDVVDIGDNDGFWDIDGWTYVCKFKDKHICYYEDTNEVEIWEKVRKHIDPFEPKKEETILVSNDNESWVPRKFLCVNDGKWVCYASVSAYYNWTYGKTLGI